MTISPRNKTKCNSNILQMFGLYCTEMRSVQADQLWAAEAGLNVISTSECGGFQKTHWNKMRPLGLAANWILAKGWKKHCIALKTYVLEEERLTGSLKSIIFKYVGYKYSHYLMGFPSSIIDSQLPFSLASKHFHIILCVALHYFLPN